MATMVVGEMLQSILLNLMPLCGALFFIGVIFFLLVGAYDLFKYIQLKPTERQKNFEDPFELKELKTYLTHSQSFSLLKRISKFNNYIWTFALIFAILLIVQAIIIEY